VADQLGEHRSTESPAAGGRDRGHAPDPPGPGLPVGEHEADGQELLPVEGADRVGGRRLAACHLLERLVRAEDRLAERPGGLERHDPDDGVWHEGNAIGPPRARLVSGARFRELLATAPSPDGGFGEDLRALRATRARRRAFVEHLLAGLQAIPISEPVARVHADVWSELSERGEPIGAHDLWIAATAIAHGLILATRNSSHFERVPGLRLAYPPA
jgi:predicted nucleic acid-binding protein